MRPPTLAGLLALTLTAAALAGCTDSLSTSNFGLKASDTGFDKGGWANFTLTYDPRALPADTSYTLDVKKAIELVEWDQVGSVFGGDSADDARHYDLRLVRHGEEVQNFTFTATDPSIEVRLRVPDSLATGTYTLVLGLFGVGKVESNEFRVVSP